jgi:hypothetical protein
MSDEPSAQQTSEGSTTDLPGLRGAWEALRDSVAFWWIEPTVSFNASKVPTFGSGGFAWNEAPAFDELWLWGEKWAFHAARMDGPMDRPSYEWREFSIPECTTSVYLLGPDERKRYGLGNGGSAPEALAFGSSETEALLALRRKS